MTTDVEVYQSVCDAPDMEEAIASLSWLHRRLLYGYVLTCYCENSVSGMILGRLLVDAGKRLYEGGNQS